MARPLTRPDAGWPLARAAERLGVTLPEPSVRGLATWLDLLGTWNARVDLTAARSPDELIDLMVIDALILAAHLPPGARVIDVGTGAGAPGLALAILRPDLAVTLVEPLRKRSAFLRTVVGTLALPQVTLDPRSGEAVAAAQPNAWDVALARATLPPAAWLALGAQLVSERGTVWVFLAKEDAPEHPVFAREETVSYAWPLTGAARTLVRYGRGGGRAPG